MKKIWDQYSYAIILVVLSFTATLLLLFSNHTNAANNEYMTVTVQEGESLWLLSMKYEENHQFSSNEFVKWVEKKNHINGDRIMPGDTLIIPVISETIDLSTELASSADSN
ncbi:LysM peptidoglycan-binding domain-containing protein [Bacillus sp. 31A1R]|uniref:LysM peptidoglycan-binding domain-containing protein n=1 Tax=Robertmurraya mangrovi TaxID=3098077 RepID=A0ABU5J205_9BACI|nr:LysM peptidoglycan-binding domain-containing protein [Bacillus sp. 31A1R]MDZ5473377.1 LysM peptidoglycan-binding domain-containing protein [Bacillus sp. 31A1R]